jgi:hypothetical protein
MATLSIFTSAAAVGAFAPRAGFALICTALLPYLTPQALAASTLLSGFAAPDQREVS